MEKGLECFTCHKMFTPVDKVTGKLRDNLIHCRECAAEYKAKDTAEHVW